jgi:hypothetical protein
VSTSLAPIVLFVYNRPLHTRQTVQALQQNELAADSDLFIYSDAAKSPAGAQAVNEVRCYLKCISGFNSVTIVEREANLGLAGSIIRGVSETLRNYGRVIVLEDDLVTSPHFLSFMNRALDLYQESEQVISVHGYVYPISAELPETFFIKGADCWGWATWSRGWQLFDPDGSSLLSQLKARRLTRRFDFNGSHGYTRMLQDQIAGRNDSWAVRWYASALLHDKLTLYPGRSLVQNIGNDNSGTNCGETGVYDIDLACEPVALAKGALVENESALRHFERYFRACRLPLFKRLLRRLGLGRR